MLDEGNFALKEKKVIYNIIECYDNGLEHLKVFSIVDDVAVIYVMRAQIVDNRIYFGLILKHAEKILVIGFNKEVN